MNYNYISATLRNQIDIDAGKSQQYSLFMLIVNPSSSNLRPWWLPKSLRPSYWISMLVHAVYELPTLGYKWTQSMGWGHGLKRKHRQKRLFAVRGKRWRTYGNEEDGCDVSTLFTGVSARAASSFNPSIESFYTSDHSDWMIWNWRDYKRDSLPTNDGCPVGRDSLWQQSPSSKLLFLPQKWPAIF